MDLAAPAARLWLLGCGTWLAACLPGNASSQVGLMPSAVAACLTNVDGIDRPAYPPQALLRKDSGTIDVTLTFDDSRSKPRLTFNDNRVQVGALKTAVEDFAKGLRVPCMAAGAAPVVLRASYAFVPNDGRKVVHSAPRDAADDKRQLQLRCVAHIDGAKQPDYPLEARRKEIQGPVLTKLTFSAPDVAPASELIAGVESRHLRDAVQRYQSGLRMPCFDGVPVQAHVVYRFALDGGERWLLKDLTLAQALSAAKEMPKDVYFDLQTMGCPFDLRIQYTRPHLPNSVQQLERADALRAPFIDWLKQLTFNLPDPRNTSVLGQEFTLAVPCAVIDL